MAEIAASFSIFTTIFLLQHQSSCEILGPRLMQTAGFLFCAFGPLLFPPWSVEKRPHIMQMHLYSEGCCRRVPMDTALDLIGRRGARSDSADHGAAARVDIWYDTRV